MRTQKEGILSQESASSLRTSYKSYLNDQLSNVDTYVPKASMLEKQWSGLIWPSNNKGIRNPKTGVERHTLEKVGHASTTVPEGFVRIILCRCWLYS